MSPVDPTDPNRPTDPTDPNHPADASSSAGLREPSLAEVVDGLDAEILEGRGRDRALSADLRAATALPMGSRAGRGPGAAPVSAAAAGSFDAASELRLIRLAQEGDAAARAALVDAFMPRIAHVAATYRAGQVQRQELLQEGVVGLLRALDRFDPERGVPFWGYATFWVRQAMQQLVAELARPFVLSDRALRGLASLRQAEHEVVTTQGREPTREELASRSGLGGDQVDALLAAERPARSLDQPVDVLGGGVGRFGDLLVDPSAEGDYERVIAATQRQALRALLAGLSARERDVIRARFGLDGPERSRREIGERLGLSGERVRQIEQRALGKLAAELRG